MNDERRIRIKRLFEAAIDLDPVSRAAFLRRHCQDEPSLGSEVEELIDASEKAGQAFGKLVDREARSLFEGDEKSLSGPASSGTSAPLVEFVKGSLPRLASEHRQLLLVRLRAVGVVLCLVASLLIVRPIVRRPAEPDFLIYTQIGLFLLIVSATILLFRWDHPYSASPLGYVLFLAMSVFLAAQKYSIFDDTLQERIPGSLDPYLGLRTSLPFLLLIFVYAMFVPNSWKRAAWVIVPIALTPVGIGALFYWQNPQTGSQQDLPVAEGLPLLIVASLVALYGVHVTNSLRREAFRARQFGQYRLTEEVGRGGMGEVWRAEHRMLSRPAAVKLIRPESLGAESSQSASAILRRFEREARATARLSSVHTIQVFDFGLTDDGTFYYVMELLEGWDLESLVSRYGPLPPARVAYLMRQACESLAEAHEQSLIHRDIKPSNIHICRLGLQCDVVKVLDFGLVKASQQAGRPDPRLTHEGMLTGTPAYLAPEQALGQPVDGRTDLYALGCVGYWLLTGKLVFEKTAPLEMILDHLRAEPTKPSVRLGQELPNEVEQIILDCLEKDPRDRPQSAQELARRLDACSFEEPWGPEQAARWWGTHLQSATNLPQELNDMSHSGGKS